MIALWCKEMNRNLIERRFPMNQKTYSEQELQENLLTAPLSRHEEAGGRLLKRVGGQL